MHKIKKSVCYFSITTVFIISLLFLMAIPAFAVDNVGQLYKLSDAKQGDGLWNFYFANSVASNLVNYKDATLNIQNNSNVVVSNIGTMEAIPFLFWNTNDNNNVFIRPESDSNVSGSKGSAIICWTAPADGDWLFNIDVANVGTDVYGGDGGTLQISYITSNNTDDTNVINSIYVYPSTNSPDTQHREFIRHLNAGEKILLHSYAGVDGYADCWKLNYFVKGVDSDYYTTRAVADANSFKIASDDKKFMLISTTNDDASKFLVLAGDDYGRHSFDSNSSSVFNPSDTNNIAYWLNNNFLSNGNGVGKKLPSQVVNYINKNHQWDTFNYGISLLPLNQFNGNYGKFTANDNIGLNNISNWSFSDVDRGVVDITKYKNMPNKTGNLTETILSNPNGSCSISFQKQQGASYVKTCNGSNKDILISWVCPYDGDWIVNYNVANYGTDNDSVVKLSHANAYNVFDTDIISSAMISSGQNIDKLLTYNVKKGDKLNLRISAMSSGVINKLSFANNTYSEDISKIFNVGTEGWWLRDGSSGKANACLLNSGNLAQSSAAEVSKQLYVRPAFYLSKEFFKNVKLDIDSLGTNIKSEFLQTYTKSDLANIYTENELNTIFDPNRISILTARYNQSNVLQNITIADKKIPIDPSEVISGNDGLGGKYRTFLWEDMKSLKPISYQNAIMAKSYKLSSTNGNDGVWSFLLTDSLTSSYDQYTSATITTVDTSLFASVTGGYVLPYVNWMVNNNATNDVLIRPESDSNATNNKGDFIICWTAPSSGNWLFKADVTNIGTDVKGGDGGLVSFKYLAAGKNIDTTVITAMGIPPSSNNPEIKNKEFILDLKIGDKVLLHTSAGADGYGDCWKLNYTISSTSQHGDVIIEEGDANYLSRIPSQNKTAGASISSGLHWIGMDGNFANGANAQAVVEYIKNYIPNVGVAMLGAYPERQTQPSFYRTECIPTIIQDFGSSFSTYYNATGAWEWQWNNVVMNSTSGIDLGGTGHAVAIPHPSNYEAFGRLTKASIKSGYTAFGYNDYCWMWGSGRGNSGYNPKTIEAFRRDLLGLDDGLKIKFGNGSINTYKFKDYANYYFGGMPIPADLSLADWLAYTPLNEAQYTQKQNAGIDCTPYRVIFDILVHYEWLKCAQFMGDTANAENGVAQIMPNPEDMPNGSDLLFLSASNNINIASEEYFGTPTYLDGAYYHFPYFKQNSNVNNSLGYVMECGGGGNAGSYYEPEIAYMSSYEIKAATGADHIETDFWPSASSVNDITNNSNSLLQGKQILSYGMGFNDAKADNLHKVGADFISVTSRRIFRPFDEYSFNPWSWNLGAGASPEFSLAKSGYLFDGISEEGLMSINTTQNIMVYSPSVPIQKNWEKLISFLNDGTVKNVITNAQSLQNIVTSKLSNKTFSTVYSNYSYSKRTIFFSTGTIRAGSTAISSDTFTIDSNYVYSPYSGDTTVLSLRMSSWPNLTFPIVVQRTVGQGKMYVVLFDPSLESNAAITKVVYQYLLGQNGVNQRWVSVADSGTVTTPYTSYSDVSTFLTRERGASVRLYENNEMTVVGVQNRLGRSMANNANISGGSMVPYNISGSTSIKVLLTPNTTYNWGSFPSCSSGIVSSDSNGYISLSFTNASQQLFYVMPQSSQSVAKINAIFDRKSLWTQALTFGK